MFISRIIMAASTDSEDFSSIRLIISDLVQSINCDERIVVIMNTAVPSSSVPFPLLRTKPVRARVMLVISSPSTVAARESAEIHTRSEALIVFLRNRSRSQIFSSRSGRGR